MRIVRGASGHAYQRGAYDNAEGHLVSRTPAACQVALDAGTQLADVPLACVEPLRPTHAGARCIVVDGAYRGSRVTVESLDGDVAHCTMGDGQAHDVPLALLALA